MPLLILWQPSLINEGCIWASIHAILIIWIYKIHLPIYIELFRPKNPNQFVSVWCLQNWFPNIHCNGNIFTSVLYRIIGSARKCAYLMNEKNLHYPLILLIENAIIEKRNNQIITVSTWIFFGVLIILRYMRFCRTNSKLCVNISS